MIGGRYRIAGLLGEGGMARVFDAFDERLERRVAIKILRPETETLPGMRQRFQQEARIAARLVHPNILAVLDYGEDYSCSYLVMERLPGTTLRDEIAKGPLALPRLLLVVTETLAALGAAHRFGVLHRDVKPSNILLGDDGHIKITDFGIAKSVDAQGCAGLLADDVTITGVVLGTPGYLAPERRSGRPATVQSDLYSVGAVIVEGFTGRRLGPGPTFSEGMPASLTAVVGRALAVDPRARFGSAEEMLRSFRAPHPGAVTKTQPVPTRPMRMQTAPVPEAPPRRKRHRHRVLSAAVAGVVAAVALLASLFLLLENTSQPTGPAASLSAHHGPHTAQRTTEADPERTAIRSLAASLAGGGLPGDVALAQALKATAAQPVGPGRTADATEALALAQVLLDGGGISSGQYQDVVDILSPTGATTPDTAPTVPTPLTGGPGTTAGGGIGDVFNHGHGHGDGQGGRG